MFKLNKSQFVWFLILLGFSIYLSYLIFTGNIYTFINPKMVKYTIFSLVGFIVLTFFQLNKIFMISRNNKFKLGYMLFLFPLLLGFSAKGLDSSIADDKNITLTSTNSNQNGTLNISSDNPISERALYLRNDGVVIFRDQTYYKALNDISLNLKDFKGKQIEITGFVYNDEGLPKDEFVVARMMMSCCAADAQVIGIASKWQNSQSLNKGEWVKLKGIIDATPYIDPNTKASEELPLINVTEIERNQPAGNQYIYP